jgi:hypothetical protein
MKRHLSVLLAFISVLTLLFTAAASSGVGSQAPTKNVGVATLMVTRFVYHKGYTFVFQLSGPFKPEDLVGYVDISGTRFPLGCNLKQVLSTTETTSNRAVCTASVSKRFAGRTAWVLLATSGAYAVIPEPDTTSCYPVYDWNQGKDDWEQFADYCADAMPTEGMAIRMYNPHWQGTFTYIYQYSAPCVANKGRGFYFGITDGSYYSILCPPN